MAEAFCRAGGGMESKSSFYEWGAPVLSALTLMAADRVSKWARCALCITSTIFLRTRQDNSTRSRGDGQRFLQITTGDTGKGRRPLNVIQNWTAQLQGK